MNIQKITLVVEKSTREIFYYSLILNFKRIFIELFTIGCKKKNNNNNNNKINHTFLNKKDILNVIH